MKIVMTVAIVLAAFTAQASAQEDDHGGLRGACGADFRQYCAGIPAGGGSRMQCLKDHRETLSAACKTAMNATQTARQACALDVQKYCAEAKPGADRSKCMKDNKDKLSEACQGALSSMAVGAD